MFIFRSRIKIYFCTQVRWLFRIILTSCVQSISKWWSLDTVFVFSRCRCRNCIVASLQNIGEHYCCSKLDFAVSYSSRSEGHNYHILWWYFELQVDRIHINHLRSLVAADPTFRLTTAFTVCKKYFLFQTIEQERKLIYHGKEHLLSKIFHHSSVSLGSTDWLLFLRCNNGCTNRRKSGYPKLISLKPWSQQNPILFLKIQVLSEIVWFEMLRANHWTQTAL